MCRGSWLRTGRFDERFTNFAENPCIKAGLILGLAREGEGSQPVEKNAHCCALGFGADTFAR
jgi:hypothetical protein